MKLFVSIFICLKIFTGFFLFGYAQVFSDHRTFKVEFNKGCAPLDITITGLSGCPSCHGNAVSYFWDFTPVDGGAQRDSLNKYTIQNASPFDTVRHTYSRPGTYTLTRVGIGQNGYLENTLDQLRIHVKESPKPVFSSDYCSGRRIQLNFSKDPFYDSFEVAFQSGSSPQIYQKNEKPRHQYADTSPQIISVRGLFENGGDQNCASVLSREVVPVETVSPPVFESVESLGGETQIRIGQLPPYSSLFLTYSNIVPGSPSIIMLDSILSEDTEFTFSTVHFASTQSYGLRLNYDICQNRYVSAYTVGISGRADHANRRLLINRTVEERQFDSLVLFRNDERLIPADKENLPFPDSLVVCGGIYTYRWKGYRGQGIVLSDTVRLQSLAGREPLPIDDFYVSVQNEQDLLLSWEPLDNVLVDAYFIHSGLANVPLETKDSLWSIANTVVTPSQCFYVFYKDKCGQFAPSKKACSIFLEKQQLTSQSALLEWNEYEGWNSGTPEYTLEQVAVSGDTLRLELGQALSYEAAADQSEADRVRFRISAADGRDKRVYSNWVEAEFAPVFVFPTAFSPNGDGLNDTYRFVGAHSQVSRYSLMIFNRWGSLVFSTEDAQLGWDGTQNGRKLPEGSYSFMAKIVTSSGTEIQKRGVVHLIRKRVE
ncbi:MAG: gliding motility-associated C-terminal domain-containing protein [Cytophagales bacterium]|nr:gliding motility-associated C-terminal domain-containing protein [Cytophagales bacterium]